MTMYSNGKNHTDLAQERRVFKEGVIRDSSVRMSSKTVVNMLCVFLTVTVIHRSFPHLKRRDDVRRLIVCLWHLEDADVGV